MSTFKVEIEREVIITEKAHILIEADSQAEAEAAAPEAVREAEDVVWKEDADLADIGEAIVGKVSLHAYVDAEPDPTL